MNKSYTVINRPSGFTLLEVLIAVALMTFVALTMTMEFQFFANQNAKQNTLNDIQNLVNVVTAFISNPVSCQATFQNQVYNSAGPFPEQINGINFTSTTSSAPSFSIAPNSRYRSAMITSISWVGPDTPLGTGTQTINGTPVLLTSHLANLQISAINGANTNLNVGTAPISRVIQFTVSIDSSNLIQSCTSAGLTQCQQLNGVPFSLGCRIPGSTCPPGTTQIENWTTTTSTFCLGGSTTGCNGGVGRPCTTGFHGFSNQQIETCTAKKYAACGPAGTDFTCTAAVLEVGCALPTQ